MNIFHKFTWRSLRKNRVRSIVTVVGIMLSMAMFTAVIEAAYSGLAFLLRAEESRRGLITHISAAWMPRGLKSSEAQTASARS